jgi:DNA repair exonuclease SbcCD ATPase subunit
LRNGLAGTWSGRPGDASNQGGYIPIPPDRPLTPEERRAIGEQYAELQQEATGIRELLGENADLDRMVQDLVRSMNNLDWARFQGNPALLEQMRAELTDRWKDLELRLRRELQMEEPDSVRLANQERVPERYRAIVEEYYRSISKSKQ